MKRSVLGLLSLCFSSALLAQSTPYSGPTESSQLAGSYDGFVDSTTGDVFGLGPGDVIYARNGTAYCMSTPHLMLHSQELPMPVGAGAVSDVACVPGYRAGANGDSVFLITPSGLMRWSWVSQAPFLTLVDASWAGATDLRGHRLEGHDSGYLTAHLGNTVLLKELDLVTYSITSLAPIALTAPPLATEVLCYHSALVPEAVTLAGSALTFVELVGSSRIDTTLPAYWSIHRGDLVRVGRTGSLPDALAVLTNGITPTEDWLFTLKEELGTGFEALVLTGERATGLASGDFNVDQADDLVVHLEAGNRTLGFLNSDPYPPTYVGEPEVAFLLSPVWSFEVTWHAGPASIGTSRPLCFDLEPDGDADVFVLGDDGTSTDLAIHWAPMPHPVSPLVPAFVPEILVTKVPGGTPFSLVATLTLSVVEAASEEYTDCRVHAWRILPGATEAEDRLDPLAQTFFVPLTGLTADLPLDFPFDAVALLDEEEHWVFEVRYVHRDAIDVITRVSPARMMEFSLRNEEVEVGITQLLASSDGGQVIRGLPPIHCLPPCVDDPENCDPPSGGDGD